MLPGRVATLLGVWAGYKKTGLFLIYYAHNILSPCGMSDDLGLFLYVPLLSSFLQCDPCTGSTIFFGGMIALFIAVTGYSFYQLTQSVLGYVVIVAGFYRLMGPVRQFIDVYIVYMFVFITVPLLLVALEKKQQHLFLQPKFF